MSSYFQENAQGGVLENFEQYVYTAIEPGSTRVLHLDPGEYGTPLHAQLEHVVVPQSPTLFGTKKGSGFLERLEFPMPVLRDGYEAISYAWGDAIYPHHLYVNGMRVLKITESLHSALQHFRYVDSDRRLWADAVCIDQSNTKEVSAQLAIMSNIFANAQRVLVWLGPSEPGDALAFRSITDFFWFHERVERVHGASTTRYSDLTACECCGELFDVPADAPTAGRLASLTLLHRPWFSRLWVVPEVLCAKSPDVYICSGLHRARFNDFLDTTEGPMSLFLWQNSNRVLAERTNHFDLKRTLELLTDCRWVFSTNVEVWETIYPVDPLTLIAHTSGRSCTKDQDRVFALWSILQLPTVSDVALDYNQTLIETYRRFVVACSVRQHRRPTMATFLALVGTEASTNLKDPPPSWVPQLHRLTAQSKHKIFVYNYQCGQTQWAYSLNRVRSSEYWKVDHSDGNLLHVRGNVFAQVTAILPNSYSPATPLTQADVEKLIDWYGNCQIFAGSCLDKRDLNDSLPRILASSIDLDSIYSEPVDDKELYYYALSRFQTSFGVKHNDPWKPCTGNDEKANSHTAITDELGKLNDIESVGPVIPEELNLLVRYSFRTSKITNEKDQLLSHLSVNGFKTVGRVPSSAQCGDLIFAFYGAPYPIVLRKKSNGHFRVIGDAFAWKVPLKQALGGSAVSHWDGLTTYTSDVLVHAFQDWSSKDEEMQQLVNKLGWITLE